MSTYSDKTTFYAYYHKDDPAKLVTSLFESRGAATSDLYREMEWKVMDVSFSQFVGGTYNSRYRAYRKAVRDAAKALAGDDYVLVTYRLVREDQQ